MAICVRPPRRELGSRIYVPTDIPRHQIVVDSLLFNILTALGWAGSGCCCSRLGHLEHHTVVVVVGRSVRNYR